MKVKAIKIQEAPNIYPKHFCPCGQLVGGYKVRCFMGIDKAPYCPKCGNQIEYKEDAK